MNLATMIVLPLVGFLLNGLIQMIASRRGTRSSALVSGTLATGFMLGSFVVAIFYFLRLKGLGQDAALFEESLFKWINLGGPEGIQFDFALRLDRLSGVFCLVITGVGTLIHLYSIGYMAHDATPARFFAYLNLFCLMMLILVLGSSLPVLFLGWEGVGLASYLLIGYWHSDVEKVKAGQKAFVMNRIGDLGLLLAMFIAYSQFKTLDLIQLNQSAFPSDVAYWFGLFLFLACTGKSAQIPLFTWLPDAMAGPTPVSALIHAATMVTSGIYLLTRLSGAMIQAPEVMTLIAVIGATTAFVAATIACAQSDIKKVLAYSTVSQLGFMFLACGVGAFDAGVFHVVTHAFFKALLFLGAGSVIHSLHEEQNIFKMGSIWKNLPWTAVTFVLGWAAIIGIPPLSGYFSKDEILYRVWVNNGIDPTLSSILFFTGTAAALLTAFYMTRLGVLVFLGQDRVDSKVRSQIHESPPTMLIPLVILAVLSVVGGFWGPPVSEYFNGAEGLPVNGGAKWGVAGVCVGVAILGAILGFLRYRSLKTKENQNQFLADAWRIDAFYSLVVVRGTNQIASLFSRFIEELLIQRILRWAGAVVGLSGTLIRSIQVGSLQSYLMMFFLFATLLLFLLTYGVGQYGKL